MNPCADISPAANKGGWDHGAWIARKFQVLTRLAAQEIVRIAIRHFSCRQLSSRAAKISRVILISLIISSRYRGTPRFYAALRGSQRFPEFFSDPRQTAVLL
jgi:hypothetical protein